MGCVSFIRSQSRQGVAIAERSMQLLARGLNLFSQLRWSLGQSLGPTAAPVANAAADSDEGDLLGITPFSAGNGKLRPSKFSSTMASIHGAECMITGAMQSCAPLA